MYLLCTVFTTDGSLANSALPDVDFVNIPFNAPQDVMISAGRTCTPLNVSIISDLTHEMMSKVFSLILYDLQPLSSMVHIVSGQLQTTITITDDDPENNVPPVVSCIPDVTETTPLGTGGRLVFYTEPTATDDSGIVSLQQRTHGPGTFFSSGVTQVTYIFVDPAGNTAECTFRVIVTEIDEVPPVIACVGLDVTETIPLNVFGTPVQFREPTAADNSGTAILQSRTHTPGQFFQSGTTQVTYVFRDPSGNTAECSFNIIITVGMS
ncbi:hyalin [Apostichopus japonicus]|uniref:Hyalin n=1 Tax=Stichopus japonicus TaxID=307972 RepID=A0A2G8K7Z6_STIJA|nr:hyalin [Apostichopus japonicus]